MSHYVFEDKNRRVTLITDGKWHHLELFPGVFSVAPPEPGRYSLQHQLNGLQGAHDGDGNLIRDAQKQPVGLLASVIELAVVRYPLSSEDGLTARTWIETARRLPPDFWAGTGHADIDINAFGDSVKVGLDYKVKGGEGVRLDWIFKFTRQWDVR